MLKKPVSGTYPSYFEKYIQLADGNVLKLLNQQRKEIKHVLWYTGDLNYSYAKGKWNIREVIQHLIDTERVFNYRGMCISRGDKTVLPSFDHNLYASNDINHLNPKQIWREFNAMRKSTISLFKNMNDTMLDQVGNVGGNEQAARAIPFMIAGHHAHHMQILKDRYNING